MPPKPPPAQTTLFGLPASQPPPALPRWWHVTVVDLPATEDGLAQLSELLVDLLARDLRFLVALEEHSELHRALRDGTPLAEYLRLHQSLLDQLVALRTSSIPAATIPAQVASLRAIDLELTRLRGALLDSLPRDQREDVAEHERANRVHRHHVLLLLAQIELEEAERRGELVEIDLDPSLRWKKFRVPLPPEPAP
ncbi:MAG: hypothetical protein ABIO70_11885 [Pseudomonadota bacterium]